MEEFNQQQQQDANQIESKKPAFFQKGVERKSRKEEQYEAWKKLKDMTDMNFNPDEKSHEEMREFFKVSGDKHAVEDMHDKMLMKVTERLDLRQLKFYAFLNKEFTIMNYKSARCSKHCFDSTDKPLQ